ncbi:putative outer membrane starch-binding protein [Algoriphagus ratkowskyi]|uniref:Putative outer membrane starch-binding protein n=1 Tax=Algoriphagus ratkowskyi TaxID=57028 RepID=A0A2W7RQI6_9BACT|nr:RagB/SusD family nutrient uptake outer membrane protein [Algoriphagus ratkowskyi]PZX53075.1 putative outer membrane starch-binding protein [Algoriphagus ratkowskyi]TXD76355.1 RagB/SusD family nutrient uptake outer membrane protein [Algoriphagus ratkowskyi]
MKIFKRNNIGKKAFGMCFLAMMFSCNDDFLYEEPLSSLSADNTLVSVAGFQTYMTGLSWAAREEYAQDDNTFFITNFPGTDVGEDAGAEYFTYRNWISYLTSVTPEVNRNWNWAYGTMLPQANTVIVHANKDENKGIWANTEQKNAVIAEAKFYRAYAHNFLANLYGGVPIVDTILNVPKYDYERQERQKVYEFAKNDLEFASKWLPTAGKTTPGRISKGAADHLLTELYISLGQFDKAIESASRVIESGDYKLMTSRFGKSQGQPGDVFSDLFKDGNFNRNSGNLESIYVWQFESFTAGGGGTRDGNAAVRNIGPFYVKISDPNGIPNIPSNEMGRGVGRVRGTIYSLYEIWNDKNDIRNSQYNMRRDFYFNNPQSTFFGKLIPKSSSAEDTLRSLYSYPRKIEGEPWNANNTSGRTSKDVYVYRLAETYLLRAEAYFRSGNLDKAAADLNALRARSNARLITSSEVSIDFILDERARELLFEEPRRRTLIRMGKLVERVRKYGLLESSRNTIQDYNQLWPIPQVAIDANFGKELQQNSGY